MSVGVKRLKLWARVNIVQLWLHCIYPFDNSVGTGGWSIGGVTTDSVTTGGNSTVVQCSSTHLTSFAVLVDVGGLQVSFPPLIQCL